MHDYVKEDKSQIRRYHGCKSYPFRNYYVEAIYLRVGALWKEENEEPDTISHNTVGAFDLLKRHERQNNTR